MAALRWLAPITIHSLTEIGMNSRSMLWATVWAKWVLPEPEGATMNRFPLGLMGRRSKLV